MTRYEIPTPDGGGSVAAQIVAGLDDDQLVALLTERPDLTEPPPRTMPELQQRIGGWSAILIAFQTLDTAAQKVLQAFSLLPPSTRVGDLAHLLGPEVTTTQLEPILARLVAKGLLARDEDGELRVLESCYNVSHPAGLGPPLRLLATAMKSDDLHAIAREIGAVRASQASRKDDIVAALRAELVAPGRVLELLDGAPEPVLRLARSLAAGPPYVPLPYYGMRRGNSPTEWLMARGLVLAAAYEMGTMPREVALALRGGLIYPDLQLTRPPLELLPVDAEAVQSAAVERARQLVRDVLRLVEELDQRPATLLKSGGVGIREVRRVATLLGADEAEAAQLIELAAAAGLLGRDHDRGRLVPAAGFDGWHHGDTTSRWAALVSAWLGLAHHLSLAGTPDDNGKPTPPMVNQLRDPHARRVRRVVLDILASAPDGAAATDASLIEALSWEAPGAWGDRIRPVDLIGELARFGLAAEGSLTDLGRALADGALPLAREALTHLLPAPTREFVLQADFTAIASGELAADVRFELELCADLESAGVATVYRFSPASLRRALDAGRDSAALLVFLEEHATRGVPQPLTYLVTDLGRRFGQLRLRSAGCYIRSEDTALLAELARTRAFASLRLSLIAPTVLTAAGDVATVMAALRAEGHLPAAEDAAGQIQLGAPDRVRAPVIAQPHSSPALPAPYGMERDRTDLLKIVARLREPQPERSGPQLRLVAGVDSRGAVTYVIHDPDSAAPDPDALVDPDEPARPVAPVSGRRQVIDLLSLATDEEWVVGVRAGGAELMVLPYAVENGRFVGENAITGREVDLPLTRLTSARVLDHEEEDRVLFGG